MVEEIVFPAELHADRFDHPELRQLAKTLPVVLVRAANRVATYLRSYKSWKSWPSRHDAAFLPGDSVVFALYVVSLIQQNRSVNSAVYGVSWVHRKSGNQEPSEYPVVKQVVDAVRRILARPAEHKEPLSSVVVQKVISCLEKGNLGDLQLAALFSLGFFGFLRWDDLCHLSVDSFYFADSHAAIFLEKRKNDLFRQGSWVFVARCSTPPCPVQIVERFLRVANHSKGSPLFRRMLHTKRGVRLQKEAMSYSRAKELVKKELEKEGLDPLSLESIACVQEELLQQQLSVCQTDSSRDMEVGEVRTL